MKKFLIFFLIFHSICIFSQNHEANDCVNVITICGNQSISLNPNGFGVQEIAGVACSSQEYNSLWIKFTAKTSGTLGFDLIPSSTDLDIDYDFWIFGPNISCGSLGPSIRCSTTNPLAAGLADNHTGMRDSEPDGDFFEGPGYDGDGYIKSLDVTAGQTYYLVIDRPIGDGAFSLNWTGTATIEDPFGLAPYSFGTPSDVKICTATSTLDFKTFDNTILNNNPQFAVSYYNSNDDANYNLNPITSPLSVSSKTYYYRIQSLTTHCFRIGEIKVISTPLSLSTAEIKSCEKSGLGIFDLTKINYNNPNINSIKFYKTQAEANNHIAGTEITNTTNYSSTETKLYTWVTTNEGCETISDVDLKFNPIPDIDIDKYSYSICDNDFDGYIDVKFSDITPIIITNYNDFDVIYSLKSNPTAPLPNDVRFNTTTAVIVQAKSKHGCDSVQKEITFSIKPRLILNKVDPIPVCDNLLINTIDINLSDYKNLFSTTGTVTYYKTYDDAKKSINPISINQTITSDTEFYLRFDDAPNCSEIGVLKLLFKQPKKSDLLKDKIICINSKTTLDAGPGFQSYLWSTGSTNRISDILSEGTYFVDLEFNNCIYRQTVKVELENEVIINYVEISDNKLTIFASGGSTPYQYSLDGINWQNSNIFHNIPKGLGKVYARSSIGCEAIPKEFLNLNLINTITPNDDGINDILDYSYLRIKENVIFNIYDRNGNRVFTGQKDHYKWDAKVGGRSVPTGVYWYIIEYNEPDRDLKVYYKSWLLVKHR